MTKHQCDILVLGGGIAGMTAAIYAARANMKTAIIESSICGGLVNATHIVENFPSRKTVHGMDLMEMVKEQVEALDCHIEEISEVMELELAGPVKKIRTAETLYEGRAVIVATGRRPIPLGGEHDCEQIHYCSICDGPAYKGKRILVVGGGNSGFDESLAMLSMGVEAILLIEKMDRFFAAAATVEQFMAHGNAEARISTTLDGLEMADGRLRRVHLKDEKSGETETVDVDGIFVFMGQTPSTEIFRDILTLDDQGYIVADEEMHTGVDGVFAAGDVRRKKYRQITTGMGDGTIAALEACQYLQG